MAERWKDRILSTYPQAEITQSPGRQLERRRTASGTALSRPHPRLRPARREASAGSAALLRARRSADVLRFAATVRHQFSVRVARTRRSDHRNSRWSEVEKGAPPPGVPLGAVGSYKLSVSTAGSQLVCSRDFTFGKTDLSCIIARSTRNSRRSSTASTSMIIRCYRSGRVLA